MTFAPITRTATCKFCGSTDVVWMKTGRWYLAEVFIVDGVEQADKTVFHSAFCKHPEKHAAKQAELQDDPPEHEVEMLSLLAGYTPAKRASQIGNMYLELEAATVRGEDQVKLDKLSEIIDLCEDFISELED